MKLSFTTAALAAAAMLASPAAGQVLIDDNFADGLASDSGAAGESAFFATNSTSALDTIATPGELGFNSGTSGRGLHTLFETTTLTNIGDKLTATVTFTTPTTIGGPSGSSIRIGLFDPTTSSDEAALSGDTGVSSGTPNAAVDIDGYLLDLDGGATSFGDALLNPTSDLNFRKRDSTDVDNGRLAQTTGSFTNIGSSGPDEGYAFGAGQEYVVSLEVELVAGGTQLTGSLIDVQGQTTPAPFTLSNAAAAGTVSTLTQIDDGLQVDGDGLAITDGVPLDTFGFLQLHINSNVFGSTGDPDVANNGITLQNVNVTFTPVPEPASVALLALGATALVGRRRKA